MDEELIKRAEELAGRCVKTGSLTVLGFLTPAQAAGLKRWTPRSDCTIRFSGGYPEAERVLCFFLPDWMEDERFSEEEYIGVIEITAHFGEPTHRDYLGAVLNLGIGREWVGDILVNGSKAWLLCLPSVKQHILLNLKRAGKCGITVQESSLDAIPKQERRFRETVFSVKSLRLDAVCAGIFGISRSSVTDYIAQGFVTLNYMVCQKNDAGISANDIISVRGKGKSVILEAGERESKKGRLFVKAGIYQ